MITQGHIDIAGRADISADMTTDAFIVVSIHIAPGRALIFLDPEYRILRAVDHAVVALKTHATAHATPSFGYRLFVAETDATFFKMTEHLISTGAM